MSEQEEREAFEHWFSDGGEWPKAVERSGDGYKLMQAHSAWRAWQARAMLPEDEDARIPAFKKAYGYLWHVNNHIDAPLGTPSVTPERAAYTARRLLRDFLTNEQRGQGINEARAEIIAAMDTIIFDELDPS